MQLGGYANRVARVDLTSGRIDYEAINEEDARKYIGARGLGVKYVFDNGPQVDALSPDNILCFLVGPLTGTTANMSSRLAIVTKSPLTGTVTDSHQGGWSGARLRWAGFDALIFRGRSQAPVYAYVHDGEVELRDAAGLWGKSVHDAVEILLGRYSKDVSVVTIGQAGENQVRFAAWVNENDRVSGRGGTGAVGGNKNLKAVVIKAARGSPEPHSVEGFREARRRAHSAIAESPITAPGKGALSVYGTNSGMTVINVLGAMPTRNGQLTTFEGAPRIAGDTIKGSILVADPTCYACPVGCKKEVETPAGKFHVHMESFEYESAWAFGAACLNDDPNAIAYITDLCNDYGMDSIEMGNVLAMAMEASEKELITERIAWGDTDAMVELVRQTALRRGLGDTLAEGTERAAHAFGDPSIAMTAKGQAIPGYDPRGLKGMGLGFATSNRGACHLRGYSFASEVAGIPYRTNPLGWEGKAAVVKYLQDLHAVSDSFDLCKFSVFAESVEDYAAQYSAVVGIPADAEALLLTGERIYNLERHYNNLAGFREGSDTLPQRFLTEPGSGGGSTGQVCELDLMLEEYYAVRAWSNGVVPDEKLRALGIP